MKKISYIKILNEYNMNNLKDIAKKCNIKITTDGKYKLKKDLIKDINIVLKKLAKNNNKIIRGGEGEPKEIGSGSFGTVYQPPFNKDLQYRYKVQKKDNKFLLKRLDEDANYDNKYVGKLLKIYYNIETKKNNTIDLENLKVNCKNIYDDVINSFKIQKCDPNKIFTIPLEELSFVSSPLNKNQLIYKYGGKDLLYILRFVNLKDQDNVESIIYLLKNLLINIYNELILRDIYHLDIRLPNILYDSNDTINCKLNLIDFGLVIHKSENIISFIKYLFKNGMNIVNRPIEYDIINSIIELDKNNKIKINTEKKEIITKMLKYYIKSEDTRRFIFNMTSLNYKPSFYIDDDNILDISNCDLYLNNKDETNTTNKTNIFNEYFLKKYLNIDTKILCEKIIVFYIGVLLKYINKYEQIFSEELINKCMNMNYLNRCNLIDIINNIDKNYKGITDDGDVKMYGGLSLLSQKPSSLKSKIEEKVIKNLPLSLKPLSLIEPSLIKPLSLKPSLLVEPSLIKPLKIEEKVIKEIPYKSTYKKKEFTEEEQEIIKLKPEIYNIEEDKCNYTSYDIRHDIIYDDFMDKNINDILNMKI